MRKLLCLSLILSSIVIADEKPKELLMAAVLLNPKGEMFVIDGSRVKDLHKLERGAYLIPSSDGYVSSKMEGMSEEDEKYRYSGHRYQFVEKFAFYQEESRFHTPNNKVLNGLVIGIDIGNGKVEYFGYEWFNSYSFQKGTSIRFTPESVQSSRFLKEQGIDLKKEYKIADVQPRFKTDTYGLQARSRSEIRSH